ncbi:MAG: hypothetical protein ACRDM8_07810 [Gaiellaceae bacterium]
MFVERHLCEVLRDRAPALLDYLPKPVELHFIVGNVTEQALPTDGARSNEVGAGARIVVAAQA